VIASTTAMSTKSPAFSRLRYPNPANADRPSQQTSFTTIQPGKPNCSFGEQTETADQRQKAGDTRNHHHAFLRLGRCRKRVKGVAEKNQQGADMDDVVGSWAHEEGKEN